MDDLLANTEVATIMFNCASDVWRSNMETDKDAMIFPFLELHRGKYQPLNDDGMFPSNLMEFKKYFNRADPNTRGGDHWMSFLMAHNTQFEDIKEEAGWRWREIKCMIWGRQCQAEYMKSVGYFLYSTRTMEPAFLQEQLMMILNSAPMVQSLSKDIEIGLWLQQILREGSGKVPADKQVRAIHVEMGKEGSILSREGDSLSSILCGSEGIPNGSQAAFCTRLLYIDKQSVQGQSSPTPKQASFVSPAC